MLSNQLVLKYPNDVKYWALKQQSKPQFLLLATLYPLKVPIFSPADKIIISKGELEHSSIITHEDGVKSATHNNSNKEGLYGAICNVVYYGQPLTQMALIYNYNLLIIRNPPL